MLNEQDDPTAQRTSSVIDDEMRRWPESPYIQAAVAEAQGRLAREQSALKPEGNHSHRWLLGVGVLALFLVGAALSLVWYANRKQSRETSGQVQEASRQPSPPPISSFDAATVQVRRVGEPNNQRGYNVSEAVINSNGRDILKLVKYEFHSSRFMVGSTSLRNMFADPSLKNEEQLISILKERKGELSNSWILIFATASLEGKSGKNMALCERRIDRIRDLIKQEAGVTARGFWGISAGEYKTQLPAGTPPEKEEEVEDEMARSRGEEWLIPQRVLIVIAIRDLQPLSPELHNRVPFVVAESIASSDMLPKTYDAPESKPFPLP